jgi:hypothetical protein
MAINIPVGDGYKSVKFLAYLLKVNRLLHFLLHLFCFFTKQSKYTVRVYCMCSIKFLLRPEREKCAVCLGLDSLALTLINFPVLLYT